MGTNRLTKEYKTSVKVRLDRLNIISRTLFLSRYASLNSSLKIALSVVRMIKMFGWEEKTRAQLRKKREVELGWIMKRFYLLLVSNTVK